MTQTIIGELFNLSETSVTQEQLGKIGFQSLSKMTAAELAGRELFFELKSELDIIKRVAKSGYIVKTQNGYYYKFYVIEINDLGVQFYLVEPDIGDGLIFVNNNQIACIYSVDPSFTKEGKFKSSNS